MSQSAKVAIPTVDFAEYRHGDAARRGAAIAKIGEASEQYGFVRIVGHGIPLALIQGTFDIAHEFFMRPMEEKLRYREVGKTDRGYSPLFDVIEPESRKPSGQEGFTMGHLVAPDDPELAALPFHAETPWPDIPGFRPTLEKSYQAVYDLGTEILGAMALHLGAPVDFFDAALVNTFSHMRVNHYPPQEKIAHIVDEGVFAHTDESLITLLIQDSNGGLEVFSPHDGWIPVEPDPSAVVVNIGKLLRHWTNGRYNAALHKVLNRSGRERYSMPVFVHPAFDTIVDPVDLMGLSAPSKEFPPIVAGEQVFAGLAAPRASWYDDKSASESRV